MNLENKVVVISGGASGLGLATARYLVKKKKAKVINHFYINIMKIGQRKKNFI